MPADDIERRLQAVERALTDSDTAVSDLSEAAAVHDRLDELEGALDDLHERVDALDATVQSLHGYVGELEAVNERVERRADAARAAVERLEDQRRPQTERATPREQAASTTADGPDADSTSSETESTSTDPFAGGEPADAVSGSHEAPFGAERATGDDRGGGEHRDDGDDSLLDRVRESL